MTSACVEAKGLPDDCYELQTLRALVSAFEDGANIVPVKLEIKEFVDKKNSLYVAIALESIKKDEVVKQGNTESGVTQSSRSSVIRIADLFAKINTIDESFLKYVPKQFLTQAPLSPGNAVFYQQRTSSRYISVQS